MLHINSNHFITGVHNNEMRKFYFKFYNMPHNKLYDFISCTDDISQVVYGFGNVP